MPSQSNLYKIGTKKVLFFTEKCYRYFDWISEKINNSSIVFTSKKLGSISLFQLESIFYHAFFWIN